MKKIKPWLDDLSIEERMEIEMQQELDDFLLEKWELDLEKLTKEFAERFIFIEIDPDKDSIFNKGDDVNDEYNND